MTTGSNRPHRCRVRATGFSHLQAMNFLCKGQMLENAPAVPGSQEIVFGEVDW